MFNSKTFKFFTPLVSLSVSLFFINKSVHSLDLTIDLPVNSGKNPILYYNSKPSEKIPPPPSQISSLTLKETKNIVSKEEVLVEKKGVVDLSQEKNFPELACLKENVDFWEKVYSDIDVNEGIVHDRNNLERVYAIIHIPPGERAKSFFLKQEKKLISFKLVSLANKIRAQSALTQQEKVLAKLFSKKELTYKSLIEAASNIRIQTGLKTQFSAGIQRSLNYMPIVLPIVKKSGLPIDLAYLPHVESSYNSRAGSKVGALGLWQLMPSTMRNLEGREAVYKRTDPRFSTVAAMKLLKINYDKIGSWPLALTAYNYGANGMIRAIQETKSKDLCKIIEKYDSPSFKFASSNFYAQFLAARRVAMRKYKTLIHTQSNSALKQNLLTATGGTLR